MDKLELELAGCLRRLLRSRYILRSRNEQWFKSIVEHRKRLQEIALCFGAEVEINETLGIIYLRSLGEEVEDQIGMRMSRRRALSPLGSILILHLRWLRLQFFLKPTGHDVPIVGVVELREFLAQFSRSNIDNQFEKQFRRSIDELVEIQVIIETGESSGFYEITSLCDLLLPVDQIHELRARASTYFASVKEASNAR